MPHDSAPVFGRVLIAGTGPTAIQLAGAMKRIHGADVGIAGRRSARSAVFFARLRRAGLEASVVVQNPAHRALESRFRFDAWFEGYETVSGQWDTLVVAAPANAYTDILRTLDAAIGVGGIARIILVSPTLGSNDLVVELARSFGAAPEVISLSSYLGDTRWAAGTRSSHVLTAGVKTRVYAGSSRGHTATLDAVPHRTVAPSTPSSPRCTRSGGRWARSWPRWACKG